MMWNHKNVIPTSNYLRQGKCIVQDRDSNTELALQYMSKTTTTVVPYSNNCITYVIVSVEII